MDLYEPVGRQLQNSRLTIRVFAERYAYFSFLFFQKSLLIMTRCWIEEETRSMWVLIVPVLISLAASMSKFIIPIYQKRIIIGLKQLFKFFIN